MIFYDRSEDNRISLDQVRENLRWCQDTIKSIDLENPLQACELSKLQTKLAQLQIFAVTKEAEDKHVSEVQNAKDQNVTKENVKKEGVQCQQAPL